MNVSVNGDMFLPLIGGSRKATEQEVADWLRSKGYKVSRRRPRPAPYVGGSETSEEAAEAIVPHLTRLQNIVWNAILDAREYGATCDELEERLGMKHQTVSARIRELADAGGIIQAGKRKTRSGRNANIWVMGYWDIPPV